MEVPEEAIGEYATLFSSSVSSHQSLRVRVIDLKQSNIHIRFKDSMKSICKRNVKNHPTVTAFNLITCIVTSSIMNISARSIKVAIVKTIQVIRQTVFPKYFCWNSFLSLILVSLKVLYSLGIWINFVQISQTFFLKILCHNLWHSTWTNPIDPVQSHGVLNNLLSEVCPSRHIRQMSKSFCNTIDSINSFKIDMMKYAEIGRAHVLLILHKDTIRFLNKCIYDGYREANVSLLLVVSLFLKLNSIWVLCVHAPVVDKYKITSIPCSPASGIVFGDVRAAIWYTHVRPVWDKENAQLLLLATPHDFTESIRKEILPALPIFFRLVGGSSIFSK